VLEKPKKTRRMMRRMETEVLRRIRARTMLQDQPILRTV